MLKRSPVSFFLKLHVTIFFILATLLLPQHGQAQDWALNLKLSFGQKGFDTYRLRFASGRITDHNHEMANSYNGFNEIDLSSPKSLTLPIYSGKIQSSMPNDQNVLHATNTNSNAGFAGWIKQNPYKTIGIAALTAGAGYGIYTLADDDDNDSNSDTTSSTDSSSDDDDGGRLR